MSASANEQKCLICGSKKEDPSTPLTAFTQISWDRFKQAGEAPQDDTYEKLKKFGMKRCNDAIIGNAISQTSTNNT